MTAARTFALLVVVTFYGIGHVATDGPLYTLAGVILLAGFLLLGYGILRPTRR